MRDNFQNGHGSVEDIVTVPLNRLLYRKDYIAYQRGQSVYVCPEIGLSPLLASNKNHPNIKNKSTELLLNYSSNTFRFMKSSVLKMLRQWSNQLEKDFIERRNNPDGYKDDYIIKSLAPKKVTARISFSSLRFGDGYISFRYKRTYYQYRNSSFKEFDIIVKQYLSRCSESRRKRFNSNTVTVIMDERSKSFVFSGFNIYQYIMNLKDGFLPERKKAEVRKEIPPKVETVPQKSSSALKTMTLGAGNIHFYNGYFLISHTIKGEVDNAVTPYRVNDADSHEILNLVHNFFEQRFEQMRIMVRYDETKILEPARSDLYQLNKYVRTLRRNLEVKGEWWEEVQNAQKRSFAQCFGEPTDSVKKKFVKSKNEYLYNLASLQNDRKLIRVYEINHGKEEDAFIFTISMSDNRCAIIFENASNDASTTTWVFIAKNENYEACVNLMFDYFTDYTISAKRSSLRDADTNPPEMFKAEDYTFIDHNDLGQWLKKLNRILENKPQPSDIAFVPGLNIPQSSDTRSGHGDAVTTKNLHNELMRRLYDRLCSESGKDNVGTEIHVGAKRIDAVVKGSDFYDLYEVKTALNPFDCVTEALGQLCQYAYLFCRDKIGKMVIVGASEPTKEVEQYLATLRKNHSLQVYYIKV